MLVSIRLTPAEMNYSLFTSFLIPEPFPLSARPRFTCDECTSDILDLLDSVLFFLFLSFTFTQSKVESMLSASH